MGAEHVPKKMREKWAEIHKNIQIVISQNICLQARS